MKKKKVRVEEIVTKLIESANEKHFLGYGFKIGLNDSQVDSIIKLKMRVNGRVSVLSASISPTLLREAIDSNFTKLNKLLIGEDTIYTIAIESMLKFIDVLVNRVNEDFYDEFIYLSSTRHKSGDDYPNIRTRRELLVNTLGDMLKLPGHTHFIDTDTHKKLRELHKLFTDIFSIDFHNTIGYIDDDIIIRLTK